MLSHCLTVCFLTLTFGFFSLEFSDTSRLVLLLLTRMNPFTWEMFP